MARGIVRIHKNRYAPTEFYPGVSARFSPFAPLAPAAWPAGDPLPVLYGADNSIGALSETAFRDVPIRGSKSVSRSSLIRLNISTLTVNRELRLADLSGHGLRRLGLRRRDMIDSDRRSYERTTLFAQAVHDAPEGVDGMLWVSRQHDRSLALVLFGDRVLEEEMDTSGVVPTYPLHFGHGRDLVDQVADELDITIIEP